jgi:hypothetical protein
MKVTYLLALLLLCGCRSASPYRAVNDLVQLSEDPKKKVFLIKEEYLPEAREFVDILNHRRWIVFDERVRAVQGEKARSFLRAVRLLIDREYYKAFRMIHGYPDTTFDCQFKILMADCLNELRVDSVSFRKKYQEAWDCTSDSRIKSIAEARNRFLKYGM